MTVLLSNTNHCRYDYHASLLSQYAIFLMIIFPDELLLVVASACCCFGQICLYLHYLTLLPTVVVPVAAVVVVDPVPVATSTIAITRTRPSEEVSLADYTSIN